MYRRAVRARPATLRDKALAISQYLQSVLQEQRGRPQLMRVVASSVQGCAPALSLDMRRAGVALPQQLKYVLDLHEQLHRVRNQLPYEKLDGRQDASSTPRGPETP